MAYNYKKEMNQVIKNLQEAKNGCFRIIHNSYDLRFNELVNKIILAIYFYENKIQDK